MSIDAAVWALREGEIIGMPTDTVYGLAVDPFNVEAIERLYELKGREGNKPLALLVASIDQAMSLASFTDQALDLADEHWPGGLTLVLPRLAGAPDWLGDPARRTIGLRCPSHDVALEMLGTVGPLAVTSANLAGRVSAINHEEAAEIFGDDVGYYLEGEAPGGQASTIIDLTEPAPLVLRRGPV
ncbi:MAG TPA: L-threonylcarbamoyladenylate synthase [Acidimicrobiia bacterium]